jgi:hypothetical protein
MNGLTAKRLRQLAFNIVLAQGESPGEGYNQYNQESNCPSWEPAYVGGYRHDFSTEVNDKGQSIADLNNAAHERMVDPDGVPLLASFYNPGTLHHAHKVTVLYKALKKLWKATGGVHEVFGTKFRKTLRAYAPPSPAA